MGIAGLNTWITSTFGGVMQPLQGSVKGSGSKRGGRSGGGAGSGKGAERSTAARVEGTYDHVLFDLNGIVHQACRKYSSERDVMKAIVFELDDLMRLFPATTSVLIALDGVGPTAKLMEQRKRRIDKVLKDARDAEALIPGSAENLRRLELCRLQGRPAPVASKRKKKGADSLQITPDTTFMLRMQQLLDWYSTTRAAGVGGIFKSHQPIILVSAANVNGEGELKLLQHVHAILRETAPASPPPSFLLIGPDADLLLLALASGTPRCDVLTTDSKGAHKLFAVQKLCDAIVAQLGAHQPHATPPLFSHITPSAPCSVRVSFGGLCQLDFLIISFLMGNDYIPKLRGAQLPRLWRTLVLLLRSEFRGEHLLMPSEGRVAINMRLLVRLVNSSCVSVAAPKAAEVSPEMDEEEDEDSDAENTHDDIDGDGDGDGDRDCDDISRAAESPPQLATSKCPPTTRSSSGGVDVEGYLRTLAWCAYMYLSGCCPDYSVTYTSTKAPTAAQLTAFAGMMEQKHGSSHWPAYDAPSLEAMASCAPLSPDVFCLCLLPAAAAPYLPRPLQAIMLDMSHPLADVFHANQKWPSQLVQRVQKALAIVPMSTYTPDERACITPGSVSVKIPALHGRPVGTHPPWLHCSPPALLRVPPSSPFGPADVLGNVSSVVIAHMPPDARGSSLARWAWQDPGLSKLELSCGIGAWPQSLLARSASAPAARECSDAFVTFDLSDVVRSLPLPTALVFKGAPDSPKQLRSFSGQRGSDGLAGNDKELHSPIFTEGRAWGDRGGRGKRQSTFSCATHSERSSNKFNEQATTPTSHLQQPLTPKQQQQPRHPDLAMSAMSCPAVSFSASAGAVAERTIKTLPKQQQQQQRQQQHFEAPSRVSAESSTVDNVAQKPLQRHRQRPLTASASASASASVSASASALVATDAAKERRSSPATPRTLQQQLRSSAQKVSASQIVPGASQDSADSGGQGRGRGSGMSKVAQQQQRSPGAGV